MSLKLKARDVFVNAKAVEKLGQNRRVWVNLVGLILFSLFLQFPEL